WIRHAANCRSHQVGRAFRSVLHRSPHLLLTSIGRRPEKETHTVSKRVHKLFCGVVIAVVFETLFLIAPCGAQQLGNHMLSVSVNTKDGTYRLAVRGGPPIFTSRVAAQVDREWLRSTDYPRHT